MARRSHGWDTRISPNSNLVSKIGIRSTQTFSLMGKKDGSKDAAVTQPQAGPDKKGYKSKGKSKKPGIRRGVVGSKLYRIGSCKGLRGEFERGEQTWCVGLLRR